MKGFTLKCKFCGNENQKMFQTTLKGDEGYSNWTTTDIGFAEFKCHKCGTFGSTDTNKNTGANKLNEFIVTCNKCGSNKWEFKSQDVDGDEPKSHLFCKNCGNVSLICESCGKWIGIEEHEKTNFEKCICKNCDKAKRLKR